MSRELNPPTDLSYIKEDDGRLAKRRVQHVRVPIWTGKEDIERWRAYTRGVQEENERRFAGVPVDTPPEEKKILAWHDGVYIYYQKPGGLNNNWGVQAIARLASFGVTAEAVLEYPRF